MSSPLNYGTPSSLSTPRSNLRGAMTPARQRADLKSGQHGRSVPAPTPTRRVSHLLIMSAMIRINWEKEDSMCEVM